MPAVPSACFQPLSRCLPCTGRFFFPSAEEPSPDEKSSFSGQRIKSKLTKLRARPRFHLVFAYDLYTQVFAAFPSRMKGRREGASRALLLLYTVVFLNRPLTPFLSSFSPSLRRSLSAGCKIVERSIYGCKITHVKFETGRVYFKDLCASSDRGSKPNSSRKFVTYLNTF